VVVEGLVVVIFKLHDTSLEGSLSLLLLIPFQHYTLLQELGGLGNRLCEYCPELFGVYYSFLFVDGVFIGLNVWISGAVLNGVALLFATNTAHESESVFLLGFIFIVFVLANLMLGDETASGLFGPLATTPPHLS